MPILATNKKEEGGGDGGGGGAVVGGGVERWLSTMVTRSGGNYRSVRETLGNYSGRQQQLPQTAGNGAPDTKTERGKRRARQKDRVQFFFFFFFSLFG